MEGDALSRTLKTRQVSKQKPEARRLGLSRALQTSRSHAATTLGRREATGKDDTMSKQKYAPTAAERALYGPRWNRKDSTDPLAVSWRESAIAGLMTFVMCLTAVAWPC